MQAYADEIKRTVQAMFLPNIDADVDNYLFIEGRAALRHGDQMFMRCAGRGSYRQVG